MFITFEGIEGCGKSTQVDRLAKRLDKLSIPVVVTLEPGATSVGREIRRLLLDSRNSNMSSLAELFLYEADRAQHIQEVIAPALRDKKWVLCDRYFDATTAYQGYARGQDLSFVEELNDRASFGIKPDITFLIDCPVELGIKRALKRNHLMDQEGQDRFERENLEFHDSVRKAYLHMAEKENMRFFVIDGTLPEDGIEEAVFKILRPYIPEVER